MSLTTVVRGVRVASLVRRGIAGDVLVLDEYREVEVVRSDVGGDVGRAFLGKVVEMRIGSSEVCGVDIWRLKLACRSGETRLGPMG